MDTTFEKDFTPIPKDTAASQKIHRISLSYRQGVIRTLHQNRAAMISLGFIIIMILVASIGPFLLPNYQQEDLLNTLSAPSREHWFGTDNLGRDVLTRLVRGTRTSLALGFVAETINIIIGAIYGGISGFAGGKLDILMMRLIDGVLSLIHI